MALTFIIIVLFVILLSWFIGMWATNGFNSKK